jgi:O-antigen ligase
VAAAVGVGAGWSPPIAVLVAAATASALVLVLRLEWAALAVVGTAVFDAYLDRLSPWVAEWLAAVLLVAWLVRRAQGPLHGHRLLTAAAPAGIFAATVVLAGVAHPQGRPGLDVCARYALLTVVLLVLADCLAGPLHPRSAARVYVASCVVASLCGIVTAVLEDRHQVSGPLAGPDELAFFLIAALPLVSTLRARDGGRPSWGVGAAFATLLAAVIGTQSRGALVALGAMVVVAVLTGQLALRYAGAFLAAATTGVAFVLAVLPDPIEDALTDPQRYAETDIAQRNDLRRAAFDMASGSPVLGLGPGAFALYHQDYRAAGADPTVPDSDVAYSTPLEVSAELGVLGAAGLYAAWAVPAVAARRRWLRDRTRPAAVVLLAVDGLLVASMVESTQYLLPLWFLAAMAFALSRAPIPRRPLFGQPGGGRSSGQVVAR